LVGTRILHFTMGNFSESKKVTDEEYGSDIIAPEQSNVQGTTDAVFGEISEGGPNYRSVCSLPHVDARVLLLTPDRSDGRAPQP
jgi:hypothetical protein